MELLVDMSWLWNRNLYAFSNLTNEEGIPTGGMYGLLKFHEQVADKGYKIIACLDGYPKERKEIYEDYKANRESDDFRTKAKRGNQSLFEVLHFLGWEFLKHEEREADDLIASRAMENSKKGIETVIYSSDKDLLQLLCFPNVKISSQIDKGNFVFKNNDYVMEKIGCLPQLARYLRCFSGDGSDNIPSAAPRVQKKYLIPIAESIQDSLMLGEKLDVAYEKAVESNASRLTTSALTKLRDGKLTYCRNFMLMDLLKWYHQPIIPNIVEFRDLSEQDFYCILDRFQLKDFKANYIDDKCIRGVL